VNEINGISLSSLPFKLNKHIGILLYQEFPVTTIFGDEDGQPIIKEWIDCDENFDRYFICKTSRENLFAFVEKRISHYELFFTCINNLGFIVDEKDSNFTNISVISPNSLPYDYLPSIDSFFVMENGVHTQRIIDELDLSNIKIEPENLDEYLKNIAKLRPIGPID
jgi:hypothetical protein